MKEIVMKFESQLLRGIAPTVVLEILARGPMYGYELRKAIEQRSNDILVFGKGTLYPLLYNLEAKKFVKGKWEMKASKRPKRYYYITSTGKTHLLAAIMRNKIISTECRIIEDETFTVYENPQIEEYPYFISIPDLLLRIRASFKDDSTTEEEIIDRFSSVGILMLDDIGSEKPTEWVLQTLYLIIDHRYREMKETYITSNLSLDELSNRLSDRIASRIAGMCKIMKLKGKDKRIY